MALKPTNWFANERYKYMSNQSKKNYPSLIVTKRDKKVFKDLWKWKAFSTRAIARKHFPKAKEITAYIRLMELHKAGYLEPFQIEGPGYDVWILTQRSFRIIKMKMVDLVEKGFKSENYYHDYINTALHLGEWLDSQPEDAHTFSEQQLRKIPEYNWPIWVPRSASHRADGYSKCNINGAAHVIAFETELTLKEASRYEHVARSYDEQVSVSFVLWLVRSQGMADSIKAHIERSAPKSYLKHHFVLLEDFEQRGWAAPFVAGRNKGSTPLQILCFNDASTRLQRRSSCSVFALLDIKKRPKDSIALPNSEKIQIAD